MEAQEDHLLELVNQAVQVAVQLGKQLILMQAVLVPLGKVIMVDQVVQLLDLLEVVVEQEQQVEILHLEEQ